MDFKREFSAGCVVFKRLKIKDQRSKIVFLLGKHSGYHKWVLAKGLIEKGEKGYQTAVRETEEEAGVKAVLVSKKPIHVEKYVYAADYKDEKEIKKLRNEEIKGGIRRVEKYQEKGGGKTRVFKTVSFYLAEYGAGDHEEHGWEMEEVGWFDYDKAMKLLAFKGEKEALKKSWQKLKQRGKTTSIV